MTTKGCTHIAGIRDVTPSALGCEECLKIGGKWLHLRICRSCGHVGCCDDSPNKHATKHFHTTKHPIIEGYDPPEGWGCVMSTKSCSTSRTERLHTMVRFRASTDGGFAQVRKNDGCKANSPRSMGFGCII